MNENQNSAQECANEVTQDSRRVHRTIIVRETSKTNGMGVAGFVLALLGLILCWVPILSWILWLLGFLFSLVGIFKRPRGLAVAGLIISLFNFIMLVALIGLIITAMAV